MAVSKILLFYMFTPLADPEAMRLWQRDLCEALGLRGRILISKDGINGTVGGDLTSLKRYVRKTREYGPLRWIEPKWSEGTGLDENGLSLDFPKLSVKVRDEIVTFGAPGELRVDASGVVGGGARLSPVELHELVAARGEEVVFFDGRNRFEAQIGHFTGAVVPDVAHTRDFVAELDSGAFDHLKNRAVVTYCTGGIRCEVLSALMKDRGFDEVYQLEGGIARYGEKYGDKGLWQGSLYVFDKRGSIGFSEAPAVIGRCSGCAAPTSLMQNCADPSCREQLVVCENCTVETSMACAVHSEIGKT